MAAIEPYLHCASFPKGNLKYACFKNFVFNRDIIHLLNALKVCYIGNIKEEKIYDEYHQQRKTDLALNQHITEPVVTEEGLDIEDLHRSDGSELIPAEVPVQDSQLLEKPLVAGYTVDDEGLLSAYSIEPVMYADEEQRAGFTVYAERLNGRLAMIGFVSLLAVEVLTGHSFLWWMANG